MKLLISQQLLTPALARPAWNPQPKFFAHPSKEAQAQGRLLGSSRVVAVIPNKLKMSAWSIPDLRMSGTF